MQNGGVNGGHHGGGGGGGGVDYHHGGGNSGSYGGGYSSGVATKIIKVMINQLIYNNRVESHQFILFTIFRSSDKQEAVVAAATAVTVDIVAMAVDGLHRHQAGEKKSDVYFNAKHLKSRAFDRRTCIVFLIVNHKLMLCLFITFIEL